MLDLSNNNLGDDCIGELEKVLRLSSVIEHLNLSGNIIGPNGLQKLCSVLSESTCTVTSLNIRNNNIPDFALKILLACLYQNNTLLVINYTVKEKANK